MSPHQRRANRFFACFLAIACLIPAASVAHARSASSAASLLEGEWWGGDTVSESLYGNLKITHDRIFWGRNISKPACKAHYSVVSRGYDRTYPDEDKAFRYLVESRMYTIIKIKLFKNTCENPSRYFQFAFPSDIPGYVDMVSYDEANKPYEWMHFFKGRKPYVR